MQVGLEFCTFALRLAAEAVSLMASQKRITVFINSCISSLVPYVGLSDGTDTAV